MRYKLLIGLLLLAAPALAQRHDHAEHTSRHEAAFFLGGTTETEEDERESLFTIGAEYEFRVLPRLGISAEVELIRGADTELFAFPAVVHVYRGLMVLAGPGWENAPRRRANLGTENRFLIRTGVQYSFHLGGRFAVIPAVDFDFVKGSSRRIELPRQLEAPEAREGKWQTVFVYGLKFAWSF